MNFDNQNTKVSDNMFANIQKHKHEEYQYLNLLEDQEVIDTIQANIDITSGGRKSARLRKRNKTFKKKSKKTIKKKKLYNNFLCAIS